MSSPSCVAKTGVRHDTGISVLYRDIHSGPAPPRRAPHGQCHRQSGAREVNIADGGVAALAQAISEHGNFAEQTPLALILIGLVEAFGYRSPVVNGLGVVLLAARLLSAYGLNSSLKQTFGRQSGATLTILVTFVAAALILYAAIPH